MVEWMEERDGESLPRERERENKRNRSRVSVTSRKHLYLHVHPSLNGSCLEQRDELNHSFDRVSFLPLVNLFFLSSLPSILSLSLSLWLPVWPFLHISDCVCNRSMSFGFIPRWEETKERIEERTWSKDQLTRERFGRKARVREKERGERGVTRLFPFRFGFPFQHP